MCVLRNVLSAPCMRSHNSLGLALPHRCDQLHHEGLQHAVRRESGASAGDAGDGDEPAWEEERQPLHASYGERARATMFWRGGELFGLHEQADGGADDAASGVADPYEWG